MVQQIILNIPDAVHQRVLDGFSMQHGRPDTVDDGNGNQITNPESKDDFTKRLLIDWLKSKVVVCEMNVAGDAAKVTARDTAISEIDIT